MAKHVQIVLLDDIDQSPADTTVRFGLDGTSYEIDLSDGNAQRLRDALAPWVAHAAKVSGNTARKPATRRGGSAAIREWAQSQGMKVSARGRVSAEIKDAYERAH